MKKFLSFFLASLILTCSLPAAYAKEPGFSDVDTGKWYYDAVTETAERGIMIGTSDIMFSPDESLTRAQLITVLGRLSGEDVTGKKEFLTFSDTYSNKWYADYVGWGAENGIITGYPDGSFMPDAPVLRQELVSFISRYLEYMEISFPDAPITDGFDDENQIPDWAKDAAEMLRTIGLIEGSGGLFNPGQNTTRAQCAALIMRYYGILPNARDIMHSRLENIMSLTEVKSHHIYLKTGVTDWMTAENIGSLLLPQLGLDINKYELVISESDLAELRSDSNYGAINVGDILFYRLSIAIKNKESGEVTANKLCAFAFEKTNLTLYVDPDDFDPGIDSTKYDEMKSRSLTSLGDLSRLAKAIDKAEHGEDITVAYIGGSITEGAGGGASACYARISANWLAKRYPDINVNYVNAGIGGTPSILGNIRVSRDVLEHNPDIVFVEFAVNDRYYDDFYTETYESLIRTILGSEGNPAVIMLFSPNNELVSEDRDLRYACQKEEQPIGEFYGIPMISVSAAVIPAIDEGIITWEMYSNDTVHPNKWGHQVYSDMIENFYREAISAIEEMSSEELQVKPLREDTYTGARYTNLKLCDRLTGLTPTDAGSWSSSDYGDHFNNGWKKSGNDSTNNPFTFTFTGSNLFLVYQGGSKYARLLVSVDGGPETEKYSGGPDGIGYGLIFSSDTPGEHTVSIRVNDEDIGKDAYILATAFN